jgi:translocation and assembly module TamB
VALGPRPTRWKKKVEDGLAGEMERQKSRVMRVNLFAPRNLWVRGTDVNLEVGLSDGFAVEYDRQLYLNGTVKVVRGKVSVIGRDFEVQRDSTVTFSGPPGAPSLNVTAAYTNQREKVTVFATLVGSGEDFSLRTSSQPALSESETYPLLATGRRSLRRGSGSAISGAQSLSVLGGLLAAQLKSALTEKLPVEIFDVLEISAGSDGFSGTRLEAGKYLTDRIYVGYVGQLGADPRKGENSNAGRIEYQFAPGWSVQATAGDAPAGSAELVWGIEF